MRKLIIKINIGFLQSISPGVVRTELRENNYTTLDEKETEARKLRPALNSEDITQGVLYVLSTPPHVQVHELTIKPVGEAF